MDRLRPKLSYGNVMASIAVFAVLGGGVAWAHGKIGTADLKNNAVTAPKVKKKAIKRAKLAPVLKPRYAVVQANGALARGRGVVDSGQLTGDGQYEVVFNRDVSNCAYVATRGSHLAADTGAATPGMVMVAGLEDEPNGVRVGTRNGFTDANDDLAFHLQVVC